MSQNRRRVGSADAVPSVDTNAAVRRSRASSSVSAQSWSVIRWKAIEYAGLVAFTVTLPRLMRPELYGHFAALVSIIGLLTTAAAAGAQATFGRFVPEFEAHGDSQKTRVLFTQLFLVRAMTAVPLATGLFLALPYLRAGASVATAAFGAGAFLSVALGMVCFQLFYGLNRLGRSLAHDGLVRLALIALAVILGGQRSLERAALALFVTEAGFLLLGLAWARRYFTREPAVRDVRGLKGKLGFGFNFFGANMLLVSVWRGGELAVLLFTGKGTEVAYYSIGNAITVAFAALLAQLPKLLIPSLTAFHVAGDSESIEIWMGLSLKYLTITAAAFVVFVNALGDGLVHVLLGDAYLPVAASLKILSLSLLPVALVHTGMSMAMMRLESRRVVVMAAAGFLAFIVCSAALVPWAGATGAAGAATLSVAVSGAMAAIEFRLGSVLQRARYARLAFAFAVAMVAFLMPWSDPVNGAVAAMVFVALLFGGGVVTSGEIKRLVKAFASGLDEPRPAGA